jgi:hypothetical protein
MIFVISVTSPIRIDITKENPRQKRFFKSIPGGDLSHNIEKQNFNVLAW